MLSFAAEILKSVLQHTETLIYLCSIVGTLVSGLFIIYRRLKKVYELLIPNGGSSIADKINRIEAELYISKTRQRLLWSTMDTGYYECNTQGECVFANNKLCEMFGLSQEQMHGNGWLRAIDERQRPEVHRRWHEAIQARIPYDETYDIINQETGDKKKCRATIFACYNNKQEPLYYFGTVKLIKE